MKQTPLPHWLQELFSLDTFHPRPIVKLALHISIGVLLLPCIVCGIVRLGGGGSTNVVGQVRHFIMLTSSHHTTLRTLHLRASIRPLLPYHASSATLTPPSDRSLDTIIINLPGLSHSNPTPSCSTSPSPSDSPAFNAGQAHAPMPGLQHPRSSSGSSRLA